MSGFVSIDTVRGAPETRDLHKTKGSVAAPNAFSQFYHSTMYPEARKGVQTQHSPVSHIKFSHVRLRDSKWRCPLWMA